MKIGWIVGTGALTVAMYAGCGNNDDTTISSSTGGVSSGTGGNLVVGTQTDGTRLIEGMDDCPPCEAGEGCLALAVSRAADDAAQPWVQWPNDADGVGILRAAATIGGESYLGSAEGIDLQANAGPHVIGICTPAGQGTATAFFDDNENADESATTSSDRLDSCAANRAASIQIAADKTLWVPYELTVSCD